MKIKNKNGEEVDIETLSADELEELMNPTGKFDEESDDYSPEFDDGNPEESVKEEDGVQKPEETEVKAEDENADDKEDEVTNAVSEEEMAAKVADDLKKAEEAEKQSQDQDTRSDEQKKLDDAMAKQRIENKALRDEIEALKESKATKAEPQAPDASEMFQSLATAVVEDDENLESAAKKAIMLNLSSAEISEVLDKALQGDFGELSEDIVEQAEKYLPRINAREIRDQANSQAEQKAFVEKYNADLQEVYAQTPDLKDPESVLSKKMNEWQDKYIGVFDNQGNVVTPGVISKEDAAFIMSRPKLRAATFLQTLSSSVGTNELSELNALKKQNEEYRKRLKIDDGAESSSSRLKLKSNSTKDMTADELLKHMESGVVV